MIEKMGHFTAVGMRVKLPPDSLVINTCSDNDTGMRGTLTSWSWSNPTNRAMLHLFGGMVAVSVECLWQGLKVFSEDGGPNFKALDGNWRLRKGKRPVGHWSPEGLIRNQADARRKVYVPAFRNLVEFWVERDRQVMETIEEARAFKGDVFLRDFDTGRGIERNGPMSHAWVLATWLNTGKWPE